MPTCRKRKVALLVLAASVALLLMATLLSVHDKKQDVSLSINDLEQMLCNGDTFILQIELEGCPACELLHEKAKASESYRTNEPFILRIPTSKKEEARTKLHQLIPQFEYYPSIFLISRGDAVSEFDLSSLDGFEDRYEQWTSGMTKNSTK